MIKYLIIAFVIGWLTGMLIMNSSERKVRIINKEVTLPAETTYSKIIVYKKGEGEIRKDSIAEKIDYDSSNNFKAELSYDLKNNLWDNKYSFDERKINTTKIITAADERHIKYFTEVGAGINFFEPQRRYEYTLGLGVEAKINKISFSITGSTVIFNSENKIKIYPQLRGKIRLEF